MSEWNLWLSIEAIIRAQWIFCVSPFYLDRATGKLKSGWMVKCYTLSIIVTPLIAMYFLMFKSQSVDNYFEIEPSGLVWRIIFLYILSAINLHFIFNMIIIAIGITQQMDFLKRVHRIDRRFKTHFNAAVDHSNYKFKSLCVLVVFLIYYGIDIIVSILQVFFVSESKSIVATAFIHGFQQIILSAQMYTTANYLFLIERRLRLIFTVYKKLQHDFLIYSQFKIYNKDIENGFVIKLRQVFQMFLEITDLVELFNKIFGWIYVSQIIQVFTTSLANMYFILLVGMGQNWSGDETTAIYTFVAVYSVIGDTSRMIINIIGIHSIYVAMDNCKHAFRYFDRNHPNKKIRQLCANFEMWCISSDVKFTAKKYMPMNASLCFTSTSGLFTYLVYLVQFQMQEDELT